MTFFENNRFYLDYIISKLNDKGFNQQKDIFYLKPITFILKPHD